jgi:tRNA dimethylallyltransferase
VGVAAIARPLVVVLCGPTGVGKSQWALRLAEHWPLSIISVDSAQVFRGLDIGTAKPDKATRERVPHYLVDIRDLAAAYSAGEFVRDARAAIADSLAVGRLPVLVGGTMLYFRALLHGIAPLPQASAPLRAELEARAERDGWEALHRELARVDPLAAARIHTRDSQRIQRALEVHRLTGKPISTWQQQTKVVADDYRWLRLALVVTDRAAHRRQLQLRWEAMLAAGLLEEVRALHHRPDLNEHLPAIRSVGYRQLWAHVAGRTTLGEASELALRATGQLAKRQMTWIKADAGLSCFDWADPDLPQKLDRVLQESRAAVRDAGPAC